MINSVFSKRIVEGAIKLFCAILVLLAWLFVNIETDYYAEPNPPLLKGIARTIVYAGNLYWAYKLLLFVKNLRVYGK